MPTHLDRHSDLNPSPLQIDHGETKAAHPGVRGLLGDCFRQLDSKGQLMQLPKIHLKTDLDGNPLDFHLTGGKASDSTQFERSLDIGQDITRALR